MQRQTGICRDTQGNIGECKEYRVASGKEMKEAGLTLEDIRAKYRKLTKGIFSYKIVGFDSVILR